AAETHMDQGPAVPPEAKEKAKRGERHVRKAAEDIYARLRAQRPMNIWAARKGYGMMRAVASAIFRATASNMSARTRRKRSLLRSASVSCSVSLSVVRDSEWQGAGCAAAQLLRGTYKRCFRAALADQNIMSIETQKENLKQQEESREFLC